MCEAGVIIGIMSSAVSMNERRAAEQKRADIASKAATVSGNVNWAATGTRIGQERVAAGQQEDVLSMEAEALRGRVRTSAAAGGVQGLSVQESLDELTMQEVTNRRAIRTSLGWTEEQLRGEALAIEMGAAGRAQQFQPTTSLTGGLLSVGAQGAAAYTQYRTAQLNAQNNP